MRRLQRVRAKVGARRRYRLILATKLVAGLLAVGVLGFTAFRFTSSERGGVVRASAPVKTLTPPPASAPVETLTSAAVTILTPFPGPAPVEALTPPAHVAVGRRAIVPFPTRVDGVKRDGTRRTRLEATADERRPPQSDREAVGAAAHSQGEQQNVDPAVPTAAIDWLLKRSRTGVTRASEALLPGSEELDFRDDGR